MQHRAPFCDIDRRAGEHGRARRLDAGGLRQRLQQRQRLVADRAFGEVEQQIVERERKAREAAGVGREQSAQRAVATAPPFMAMRLKRGESSGKSCPSIFISGAGAVGAETITPCRIA
jgi:hypothetical protein